jgi:hypothetical protein
MFSDKEMRIDFGSMYQWTIHEVPEGQPSGSQVIVCANQGLPSLADAQL